jgi:hypothetical protein
MKLLFKITQQGIQQVIQWIGFLFWLSISSYSGRFWLQFLHWMCIVPMTFIMFFRYVNNFGPKHPKPSLFDMLSNPVPGVDFDGRIGESDDFTSLERHQFNHNLVAQRIALDKHLSAKQATRSLTAIVHDYPLSHINNAAPVLLGYQRYATFHETSTENNVIELMHSMPMTFYFAICEY